MDITSGEEVVLLFLKMAPAAKSSWDNAAEVVPGIATCPDVLKRKISAALRKALSARHVPGAIFLVKDLPVSFALDFDFDFQIQQCTCPSEYFFTAVLLIDRH